jgi:TonB family protein
MTKMFISFFLLMGFSCAAQQPEFKGGLETFVRANTVYPPYSQSNCIEGRVTINFKLDQQGRVFNAFVKSGIGTDLDDEALRLIRMSSGKWKVPAGYDTTYVLVVPVNFKLDGYDCGNKSKAEIQQAINAYKSSDALANAVLNFYINKEKGIYNAADEPKILALRKELGYDKAYMEQRIKDGIAKLKQKDKEGACEDFLFVKHMGFDLADEQLQKYCR